MTHRDRVKSAIKHQEADRVPKGELWIDGQLANSLINKEYQNDYIHYQRDKEVRELLNIDLINVGDWPAEEIGIDASGNKAFRSIYGYEYVFNGKSKHITKPPIPDISDASKYRTPDIAQVSGKMVKDFSQGTELFVMAQIGGPVSMLDEMFPMEDFMVYCMTDTREMILIAEKVMEYEIQKAKLFIDNGADAILFADDIAFNSGVFLPPHIMEELVYPFYKEAIHQIKKYKDIPVIFHSDGNLYKVMDKIVESGFDGIQSLQPSAGMDIARIKRDYGSALCLMGNIDLDYILTSAPVKDVEETVKRTIDVAAPGGGFILSSCNVLIGCIPPENALAMYQTAHQYGIHGNSNK